jgi:hypothetical protein
MGFEENKNIYHGLTVLVALFAVYLSTSRLSESDIDTLGAPFGNITKYIKKTGNKVFKAGKKTGKKAFNKGKKEIKKRL